jgi:hypothetical protein
MDVTMEIATTTLPPKLLLPCPIGVVVVVVMALIFFAALPGIM